jgi:hypothetical protein
VRIPKPAENDRAFLGNLQNFPNRRARSDNDHLTYELASFLQGPFETIGLEALPNLMGPLMMARLTHASTCA